MIRKVNIKDLKARQKAEAEKFVAEVGEACDRVNKLHADEIKIARRWNKEAFALNILTLCRTGK